MAPMKTVRTHFDDIGFVAIALVLLAAGVGIIGRRLGMPHAEVPMWAAVVAVLVAFAAAVAFVIGGALVMVALAAGQTWREYRDKDSSLKARHVAAGLLVVVLALAALIGITWAAGGFDGEPGREEARWLDSPY